MSNKVTQRPLEVVVLDEGGGNKLTQRTVEVVIRDAGGTLQVGGFGVEIFSQVGIEGDPILIRMED